MQTTSDIYSIRSRRKHSYETVSSPRAALPYDNTSLPKENQMNNYAVPKHKRRSTSPDHDVKRFSIGQNVPVKSQSMQSFVHEVPPPVPTSTRPILCSTPEIPPPLPPRRPSVPLNSNHYQSPKSHVASECVNPVALQPIYNIPKSHPPPAYDSLPKTRNPAMHSKQSQPVPNSSSFATASKPMNLRELVETHQEEFPVRVEISAGYFGESERDTFSEGDQLNVHFVKQVTVAVVESGNREIKVPINSSLQFGPLFDPNNKYEEAKQGFTFKTAKELMSSKKLPLLVRANKAHKASNSSHSVEKGELLKIVEIKHGRFGGRSLVCLPLRGNTLKRLSENCQGAFSTEPEEVKLFLPEITSHLPLPQKVVPFINYLEDRDAPFADTDVVTILRVEKEKTIVATAILGENDQAQHCTPVMFDIPVDLDVLEVQVMEGNDHDEFEKLYEDTRQMMENFDPTKMENQVRVGQESIYYCDIREDQKTTGIELLASESIYQDRPSLLAMRNSWKSKEQSIDTSEEYSYTRRESLGIGISIEDVDLSTAPSRASERSRKMHGSLRSLDELSEGSNLDDYCQMDPSIRSPLSMQKHPSTPSLQEVPMYEMHNILEAMKGCHPEEIEKVKEEMVQMKLKITNLNQQIKVLEQANEAQSSLMKDLQSTVQTLQQKIQGLDYVQMVPKAGESKNVLSCKELLTALDESNMSMYKDVFKRERIDGNLLRELDEEILEKELGITSRLHRKKLMLIVRDNCF